MIVVLFGQPHSGKTTLGHLLKNSFKNAHHLDGDELRKLYDNTDYSKEGRIANLNRASDIAYYLNKARNYNIVLSLVYPYEEAREYLSSLTRDVKWIYLTYEEDRGRDQFKVADFEPPQKDDVDLIINTSNTSIEDSVDKIKYVCRIF